MTRHADPAPNITLLPTWVALARVLTDDAPASRRAHLCWHGLYNCPLCRSVPA